MNCAGQSTGTKRSGEPASTITGPRRGLTYWQRFKLTLGLKAGGGTGISALLQSAHTADHAFAESLQAGKETMKDFRALETALDALGKRCKEISDKHKKLFTEASTCLDPYRLGIFQDFQRVLNDFKQCQNPDDHETIWDAFLNEYEVLNRGFPRMQGFLGLMKSEAKPSTRRKPKEAYVKWIADSTQHVTINDR